MSRLMMVATASLALLTSGPALAGPVTDFPSGLIDRFKFQACEALPSPAGADAGAAACVAGPDGFEHIPGVNRIFSAGRPEFDAKTGDFFIDLIGRLPGPPDGVGPPEDRGRPEKPGGAAAVKDAAVDDLGEDDVKITAMGNVDPVLSFGGARIDFGPPTTFNLFYSAPIAPVLTGLVSVTASMSASCTASSTDGNCGATAAANAPALAAFMLNGTFDPGVSVGATSMASPGPSGSATFAYPNAAGIVDCGALGGCTQMSAVVSWTGTGGGDSFTFTGRFEIIPISAPQAAALGLGVLLLLLRRRLRSAASGSS